MKISLPDDDSISEKIGEVVDVKGVIKDEPSEKISGTSFTVDTGKYKLIAVSKGHSDLKYGDLIEVRGKLETPENFKTSQGTDFDYVSYLYKDNIIFLIKNSEVTFISGGHGNWLVENLIPLKNWVIKGFNLMFRSDEANLLSGLNLGEKSAIDNEFRNDLVTTGTIHMIALSGYNVTIIVNAMRDFFSDILGLGVRTASLAGILGIIIFVTMTGLQSSAIRAGIMAIVGIFARVSGNAYNAFRALIFSGFLMVMWNPKYLVYDVSFQLSFLATLGIIFVTPVLERKFAKVPKKFLFVIPLREALAVMLGAQIGVYPFIIYKMGTLSLISLPANLLVLPAIPYAMGLGMISGVLGTFSNNLAYPFAYVTHLLLSYITELIKFFAKVPFASITLNNFPSILCVILYISIIYFLYRAWNRK